MLKFCRKTKEAALSLKNLLDTCLYDLSLKGHPYLFGAMANLDNFEELIESFPKQSRLCYKLFLLGKTIAYDDIPRLFTSESLNSLLMTGLLKDTGEGIKTDGYSIFPLYDCYFAIKICAYNISAYLGPMAWFNPQLSELFSPFLPAENKNKILELNTCLGSRAILSAKKVEKATAVTPASENIDLFKFNALLNKTEDIVSIKNADDPLAAGKNEKFDIIYLRLPFIEIPVNLACLYLKKKNNELDNIKSLKVRLDDLSRYLTEDGKIIISGQAMGKEKYPFLATDLNDIFKSKNWEIRLILENRISAAMFAYSAVNLSTNLSRDCSPTQELIDNLQRLLTDETNAQYLYSFMMRVKKTKDNSDIQIFNLYNKWTKDIKPLAAENLKFESTQSMYIILKDNKELAEVDEETVDFLKMCDGKRALTELSKICAEKRGKTSAFEIDKAEEDALGICHFLKQKGILQ